VNLAARAACALALATLAACATRAPELLDSETFARLEHAPHRVFLRVHLAAMLPQAFQDGYVASLRREFIALGAEVRVARLTGLELPRIAHVEQQQAFGPELILVVQFDATRALGATHQGVVTLSLRDPGQKELWRASQRFTFTSMSPASVSDSGDQAGARIIQRMLDDRVLSNIQARAILSSPPERPEEPSPPAPSRPWAVSLQACSAVAVPPSPSS